MLLHMREYAACVVPKAGGTELVTVSGYSADDATHRLLAMGYDRVLSIG